MTIYADVLGPEGLARLAPECRALHDGYGQFRGQITVQVTANPVLRLLLRLAGFPKPADAAELVFVTKREGRGDQWARHIAGQSMTSRLWAVGEGLLAERMGMIGAVSRPDVQEGGITLRDWEFRLLGVPLPGWSAPRVGAREWPEAGRYAFDVTIGAPWGARLVRYHGWLSTVEATDEGG